VCDEYADLVSAGKSIRRDVETGISRLGAKARAAGIHLLVATQRPSRDIVAGTLKANMSCKVALKTQSAIESRIILEESGAENLLGHGDLLFADIGKPIRLQAPYLSESERAQIMRAAQ
jgi:DNA segregation ATPase FtsK/SpoIIIE-like protein